MANSDQERSKKAAEEKAASDKTTAETVESAADDLEDEFAEFAAAAKASAQKAMGGMAAASEPDSEPEDDEEDDEDDFAAFEAAAKAAAASAMAGMSGGAAAASSGSSPASDDDDDEDEEDDFAAFEAAAKAAAASAMAGMGGGAAGTEAAAGTSEAPTAPAESSAGEEQGDEETAAAPVSDDGRSAALAAAGANKAAQLDKLFGKVDGVKSQTILVVGGGIAGITAAIEAAETGYDVVLLEKEPFLGGRVTRLNRYFPKLCHPTCGLEINYQRIKRNKRLKVITMAEVTDVSGVRGDFTVKVKSTPRYTTGQCDGCGLCAAAVETEIDNDFNYGLDRTKSVRLPHEHAFPMRYVIDGSIKGTPEAEAVKAACPKGAVDFDQQEEDFTLNAGAIIWATGWKPYDAGKIEVYSYNDCPDIINNVEMERLANHDGPTKGRILRPSNGEAVKKVAMIQCAGSRDINHLPYCSMICCLASLKHAAYVREQYPDAEIDIYYIDIRAHDKMSQFYERVKRDTGITFIKSKPGHILVDDDGRPVVCGERTIDRGLYQTPYDLVVLATGMQPSLGAGFAPAGLTKDEYGFVVPAADESEGQFAAGVAGGPFDVALSNQSATAAALKAIQAVRAPMK
jgi:quinone-modifying oxidoreductase subunit QmoA